MGNAFNVLKFVSKVLNSIAGIAVTVMMLMTVADVLLRAGGHPIIGTFEIVCAAARARHRLRYPAGLTGQRACVHGFSFGQIIQEG